MLIDGDNQQNIEGWEKSINSSENESAISKSCRFHKTVEISSHDAHYEILYRL